MEIPTNITNQGIWQIYDYLCFEEVPFDGTLDLEFLFNFFNCVEEWDFEEFQKFFNIETTENFNSENYQMVKVCGQATYFSGSGKKILLKVDD